MSLVRAWGRRPEAVIRTRPRDGARSLPRLVPSTTPRTSLKLDLPPVVPPPSVAPVLPGPGGPPTRGSPPQQQQRPSLSYFLFLSLLFYLLSNNADQNTLQGDTGALERHEALLLARQGRRDGLASWLGLEVSHNGTVEGNGTAVEPTVFEPTICTNQVLLPALHAMLDRDGGEARHYPMNLTGFVKGSWAPSGYSYDELGLPEVFNSTVLRPSTAAEIAEEDGDPVPPAITPRQALNDTAPLSNTTLVPPRLRNATVTTNRTVSRGSFPWLASPGGSGGKLSFNIHSEQTTVTGPYRGMPTDDGEHLQLREGVPVEGWEREGLVVYMRGEVTLSSASGTEETALDIEAVHFLNSGQVYGYLTPATTASHLFQIVGLPTFDPADELSNRSATAAGHTVLKEVDRRIAADLATVAASGGGGSTTGPSYPDIDTPACTFALYGSLAPLPPSYSQSAYSEYYASLSHPTGSSLLPPPTPQLSYIMYSPNCGLVLTGQGEVLESRTLWSRATLVGTILGAVHAALVLLLVRQMEWGRSGRREGRVAWVGIAVMAGMDAYFFVICFTIGVVTNNRASLPVLVPAFFALISSLLFGMRYTSDLRAAAQSLATRPVPLAPPAPVVPTRSDLSPAAAERRAAGDTTEYVVVQGLNTTLALDRDEGSDLLYFAIGGIGAMSSLAIIVFYGWLAIFMILLYSYWVPQIILNIERGAARMALKKEFVILTTVGRLVLPLYIWACPQNVLAIDTSHWVYALCLYNIAQATVLLLQDSRLGARFFVPTSALQPLGITDEKSWDYHPIPFSTLDVESDLPIEDCPICLEPLDDGVQLGTKEERERDREMEGGGLGGGARWKVMVPPCHHVAHTACLENWMAVKTVCPVCRGRLPPL